LGGTSIFPTSGGRLRDRKEPIYNKHKTTPGGRRKGERTEEQSRGFHNRKSLVKGATKGEKKGGEGEKRSEIAHS